MLRNCTPRSLLLIDEFGKGLCAAHSFVGGAW
jgi:DNA mismatch repair ATPase MutS